MIDATRIARIKKDLDFRTFIDDHAEGITGFPPQLAARCPGHRDESASLSVNVEKGRWKCHAGCGAGDVVDFCQQLLGHSFAASVEYLEKYLEEPTKTIARKPRSHHATQPPFLMTPAHEAALARRVDNLERGGPWMEMLTKRGISADVVKAFRLGTAQEGDPLVMPMIDVITGQACGIRFRYLGGEMKAETGSRPSETLYGKFQVTEPTLVCEGEMDVLAMLSAGCPSVVGILGAEIGWRPEWSELLKDAPMILLCGDDDDAGARMNERIRGALLGDGISKDRIRTIDWTWIRSRLNGRGVSAKDVNAALMAGAELADIFRTPSVETSGSTIIEARSAPVMSIDDSGNFPWELLPEPFVAFAEATKGRRQLADAYWIAGMFSVAGFAIGRHAHSMVNGLPVYPSQLNVAIADQGTGKSDMLKVIGRIAGKANPQGVQAGAPDSGPGMLRLFQKSPELFLCVDEFAGLLKSLQTSAQYRNNKLPEHLKSVYEGVDLITRAVAAGTIEVKDPQLSLIAIATPDVVSPLQIPRAWFRDGLASRITFWKDAGRDFVRTPKPFDESAIDFVGKTLGDLRGTLVAGGSSKAYHFDRGAKAPWHAFLDWHSDRKAEARGDQVMEGLVARLPGKAERIALIFACVEGTKTIERDQVEGAARITRWLFEASADLFKDYGSSRSDYLYDLVLARMRAKFADGGVSTEDLWRSVRRKFNDRSELLEILRLAERYGTLTSKSSTRGARYLLQDGDAQSGLAETDPE